MRLVRGRYLAPETVEIATLSRVDVRLVVLTIFIVGLDLNSDVSRWQLNTLRLLRCRYSGLFGLS